MSKQTLSPNAASSAASAWTITGGGSIDAVLADGSDSTYVERAAAAYAESSSWLVLACSNYTIPAGSKVRRVRAKIKVRVNAGGAIGFGLADADTWRFKASQTVAPNGVATWYYGPWETSPAGGGSWTQERLDAAAIAFRDYTWDTPFNVARLYTAALEVELVAPPVVTVTAPTGSISSPVPTATWTYTATDGFQQAEYVVKVFDSATYTAGGFDPETSKPMWSTKAKGGSTSKRLGPLKKAPTQRVYVKAKATSGLWSDWAYSGYTYTVEGPTQPAIGASWSTLDQFATVVANGRVNELTANTASMESNIGTWVADNTGTTTVSSGPVRDNSFGGSDGSWAGLFTAAAAGTCRVKTGTIGTASIGQTRSARVDLRGYWSGTRSCRVGIRWIGNGSITWGSSANVGSAGWTTVTVDNATAPSGTTGWEMVIELTATASESMFFDKAAAHANGPAAWGPTGFTPSTQTFTLERSYDGTTWETLDPGGILNYGSTVAFEDRTARRDTTVYYRAAVTADLTGYAVPGDPSASATITSTSDDTVWLRTADGSIDVGGILILRELTATRERQVGVFDPLPDGSEAAYPVVIEGDLGARTGRWKIQAHSQAEVDALQPALTAREPLLAQLPYGEQWWIRITNVDEVSTGSPRLAEYDVTWIEVG